MKVLFLDIDGVLNRYDRTEQLAYHLLFNLKELVKATGCKLVISSDWRLYHTIEEIKQQFNTELTYDWPIIGMTEDLAGPDGIVSRASEIKDYLSKHPEITQYAIVDDWHPMDPDMLDFYIQTDQNIGMDINSMHLLIDILI